MTHLVAVHRPISACAISPCETPHSHRSLKEASFQNCFPSKVRLTESIMTMILSAMESSSNSSLAGQAYFYLFRTGKDFFLFQRAWGEEAEILRLFYLLLMCYF